MTREKGVPHKPMARQVTSAHGAVKGQGMGPDIGKAGSAHDIEVVSTTLAQSQISHSSRQQLIAEMAYHLAEARDFSPGNELDDWLQAEAAVDVRLQGEGRSY